MSRTGLLGVLLAVAAISGGAGYLAAATGVLSPSGIDGPRPGSRVTVVRPGRNPLATLREIGRLESVARFEAIGEVVVGVDLEELRGADVVIADDGVVRVALPSPRVLRFKVAGPDGTDGERRLTESARRSGMMDRARESTRRVVEAVLRALGNPRTEMTFRTE